MINRIYAVLAILLTCVFGSAISAQTLFHQPDTAPDYSHYRYAEDCFVVIQRVADSVRNSSSVWGDTVAYKKESLLAPSTLIAVNEGKRCLGQYSTDSIAFEEAKYWGEVFLMTDLDQKVEELYLRIYDSISRLSNPDRDSVLYATFTEQLNLYRSARPIRYDKVKDMYEMAKGQMSSDSVVLRMGLAGIVLQTSDDIGDDRTSQEMAREIVRLYDSVPKDQLKSGPYQGFIIAFMVAALNTLHSDSLDKLLKKDTDAYLTLRKTLFDSAGGNAVLFEQMNGPLGEIAPPLLADYWYESNGNSSNGSTPASANAHSRLGTNRYRRIDPTVRPVPGKLNLIVGLHGGCHDESIGATKGRRPNPTGACWQTYSTLKRIKSAYPELEITVVVNTHGNIGSAPPLEPAAEADTLADFFLGFHNLPAVLAVTERPYFNLSGLDRRRIDTPTENETNYSLGLSGAGQLDHGVVLIVDENGKIVHRIRPLMEKLQLELWDKLEILMSRREKL